MLALTEALTASLARVTPQRAMITTITPACTRGLNKVDEKTGFPTFAIGNKIWELLRGG
jgi:hypothetical protein